MDNNTVNNNVVNNETAKPSGNKSIVYVVVAVVLIAIGALAFFFLKGDNKEFSIELENAELSPRFSPNVKEYTVVTKSNEVVLNCNNKKATGCNETISLNNSKIVKHKIQIENEEYEIDIIKVDSDNEPSTVKVKDVTGLPEIWSSEAKISINVDNPYNLDDLEYSIDNGVTWQESNEFTIKENGPVNIIVRDKFGLRTETSAIEITNVDSVSPVVEISHDSVKNDKMTLKAVAHDDLTEIKSYLWSTGETTEEITIVKNGVYSVNVLDAAGNKGTASIEIVEFIPKEKKLVGTFDVNGSNGKNSTVSCSTITGECEIEAPKITRDGYNVLGWSTKKNSEVAEVQVGSKVLLRDNVTYYAITSKLITITFDKNGNTAQEVNGSQSTEQTIVQTCTLFNNNKTCSVTSPKIVMNGATIKGYTTGAKKYSDYWNVDTKKDVSKDTTYYAQTSEGEKTITITFDKNGNTSQTLDGKKSKDNRISKKCVVASVRNGVKENVTCEVEAPKIEMDGFTIHGYTTGANTYKDYWTVGTKKTFTSDQTFYAQTSKSSRTVTITFNRNGNTSQTLNGKTSSSDSITSSCVIAEARNGRSQASTCNVTSPTINQADATIHGYSNSPTAYNDYWGVGVSKSVSSNATYYAQTSVGERTITITFDKNGNTSQTVNGGKASTENVVRQSCKVASQRNGVNQEQRCSITSPRITMDGATILGYSEEATLYSDYWRPGTSKMFGENMTYYAQTSQTLTATFENNGATSIGTTSLSCTNRNKIGDCEITLPNISRNGYEIHGWSTNKDATNGILQGNTVRFNKNTTYYAITSKEVTVTFNKNGNTSQTPKGGSANTNDTLSLKCKMYNLATSCKITSPNITMSGFSILGYSNGPTTYSNYWTVNTEKSFSENATYYAQTNKEAKTVTISFNKNGNTSQTKKDGTVSSDGTITESCQIPAARNGDVQSSTCKVTSPTITMAGSTIHGYSEGPTTYSNYWAVNTEKEVSESKTYYAQTSVGEKTITITFNKNGNTSQTPKGGSASTAETITQSCSIASVRNGQSQGDSCEITSPSITNSGSTIHGYSIGATTYSNYWKPNTVKSVNENATYYAQTSKPARTVTITFNKNGNTSQTPKGGSASTATTITQSCEIPAVRNGEPQQTTCNITSPTITMEGYTVLGYTTGPTKYSDYWEENTQKGVGSNATYYAQTSTGEKTITVTFNKNGNTSQTPKGGSASTANTITQTCNISAGRNGQSQSNGCEITSPTITMAGSTIHGYTTGASTYSNYWTVNTTKTFTENATYYAQTSKPKKTITITFNKNGNTSQTPKGGSASTATTITQSCDIPSVKNNATQNTTCKVTSPSITLAGAVSQGYTTGATTYSDYWTPNTEKDVSENKTYYAQTTQTLVATFNKNGATSVGATNLSCINHNKIASCTVVAPSITRSGYNIIGWGTSSTASSGIKVGENITLNTNTTYYAITSKQVTITFNKNNNAGQFLPNTTEPNTDETVQLSCNLYGSSTSCKVRSPYIYRYEGYTSHGYTTGPEVYSDYWEQNTEKEVSENKTYYAQTSATYTVTFDQNTTFDNNTVGVTDPNYDYLKTNIKPTSINPTSSSCVSHNATGCYVDYPIIYSPGNEIVGLSTEPNSDKLVKYFPVEMNYTLYVRVFNYFRRNNAFNYSTSNLLPNTRSVIEYESSISNSVTNEYTAFLTNLRNKIPELFHTHAKIRVSPKTVFDKINACGEGAVGCTAHLGNQMYPMIDISTGTSTSTVLESAKYALVHELGHALSYNYKAYNYDKAMHDEDDVVALYNKYKNYPASTRPLTAYAQTSEIEFFAEAVAHYYHYVYGIGTEYDPTYSYGPLPDDIKNMVTKYICVAKNGYNKEASACAKY